MCFAYLGNVGGRNLAAPAEAASAYSMNVVTRPAMQLSTLDSKDLRMQSDFFLSRFVQKGINKSRAAFLYSKKYFWQLRPSSRSRTN